MSSVICFGDVQGNFQDLIKKMNLANKKGNFDLSFCVGEFFGADKEENDKVVRGEIQFPIPTYILGPCSPSTSAFYAEEDGQEISHNLTYLGRRGILTTAGGLTVAYLSGVEGESQNSFQFNRDDITELLIPVKSQSGFIGVDILLTSMWPQKVWNYSLTTPSREVEGSALLARLAAGLKPRYHFAGMGIHYERQPYRNHRVLLEAPLHTTRFIALAPLVNGEKQKSTYAFKATPLMKQTREERVVQADNTTEFPYLELLQELVQQDVQIEAAKNSSKPSYDSYRFDMTAVGKDDDEHGNSRKRGNRGDDRSDQKKPAGPCWFCLSNVTTEKHLVVSVGDSCYVAMPKGPLTDDHVMVLSIEHIQSLAAAPSEIQSEVVKYKEAFTLMADKAGKALVCFERNFRTQHLQINMIPVKKSAVKGLKTAFFNAANLAGVQLAPVDADAQLTDLVNEGCPYFFVELPDGSRLFTRQMKGFPLHFGREVLCSNSVLDCEYKVDWRNCVLSESKETELVAQLKKNFAPFDWSNDDSD